MDARKSLFVTDSAILTNFTFQRVMDTITSRAGVTNSSLSVYEQWWDTQNTKPGVTTGGAHCNDVVNATGQGMFNGFPYNQCPRGEGALAGTNPFTGLDSYMPIGLVNRFDLAPVDGAHCGEYRIVFSKRSGTTGGSNFVIFIEAVARPAGATALAGRAAQSLGGFPPESRAFPVREPAPCPSPSVSPSHRPPARVPRPTPCPPRRRACRARCAGCSPRAPGPSGRWTWRRCCCCSPPSAAPTCGDARLHAAAHAGGAGAPVAGNPAGPHRGGLPLPDGLPGGLPHLVTAAGDVWSWPHARMAVGATCALVFFAHFKLEREPLGNIGPELAGEYQQVIDALGGRTDGRVLVEQGQAGLVDPFGLQVLVGAAGGHSLTTVFRESSINVFFANPLRNSFSKHQETFGIDGKLHAGEFDDAPLEAQVARLRLFNIQYLAVQSDEVKARLAAMPQVERVSPPGRWELYAFRDAAPGGVVVPAYEPVLTFTSFSVKPRPDFGFDFVRLGAEAFREARLDTPLVLSRAGTLDAEGDWERFQTALVTEYRYRGEDAAYAALERFSRMAVLLGRRRTPGALSA